MQREFFEIFTSANNVPAGTVDAYKSAKYWKKFGKIVDDADAIENIITDMDDSAPIYNINGVRIQDRAKGLVIKNGKAMIIK